MSKKFITYRYIFKFKKETEKEFIVQLDSETLDLVVSKRESYPAWAKLKYFRCSNCPLDEKTNKFCPLALNIRELIDFFKDFISYEEVDVTVVSEARNYFKHTKIQEAVSSILGIYMVTSGCPVMDKLRPMVYVHLPFAKSGETVYRVFGMYLTAQYFLYKRGKKPDWDLKNLSHIYEEVRKVNKSFSERIASVIEKDATANALVILDCFAMSTAMTIDSGQIKKLEKMFDAYLREDLI